MMLVLTEGILALIVACFALYAVLEFRLVLLSRKCEQAEPKFVEIDAPSVAVPDRSWPRVTVLLPIYNEPDVIDGLIDAVCRLDYPRERFEVLVLDDSTDVTTDLARARIAIHAGNGLDIRFVKRKERSGFKAGNLSHGLKHAQGEFIAIFDADFLPPADFLRKTMPCFEDETVGFLQTGIGYVNRDVSFLTRFQAMIMGHQQFVTVGLSYEKLMGSLSGSSCVWRKACVESLGGWNASTITEDVDMGYRAQLNRWKYVYLRDVVSLSELPQTMSAFRVQRDRWARGLIHNAFKHASGLFGVKMSLVQRLHAVSLMFSSLLLAFFFVLILLSLPLGLMSKELGWFFHFNSAAFTLFILIWVSNNFVGAHRGGRFVAKGLSWKQVATMYAYVAMFLPLSLYYFVAGIQVLAGNQGGFNRTPKAGVDDGRGAVPRIDGILRFLETAVFGYAAMALAVAMRFSNPWLIAFDLTACTGFAMVNYYSWQERHQLSGR